jgi:hypothetical protein
MWPSTVSHIDPDGAHVRNRFSCFTVSSGAPSAGQEPTLPPEPAKRAERIVMKPFGKEFYRALAIGFLIGCAGMALNANGVVGYAQAATSHIPGLGR